MEMFMSVLLEGTRIRVVCGENMDLLRQNDNPAARKMIASVLEEVGLPDWLPDGSSPVWAVNPYGRGLVDR
jgi:hypothetical protein